MEMEMKKEYAERNLQCQSGKDEGIKSAREKREREGPMEPKEGRWKGRRGEDDHRVCFDYLFYFILFCYFILVFSIQYFILFYSFVLFYFI